MSDGPRGYADHFVHQWAMFYRETFEFLQRSIRFYLEQLKAEKSGLTKDEDLKWLQAATRQEDSEFEIEQARATRVAEWMRDALLRAGDQTRSIHVDVSHGWVRFLKASGLLYIEELRRKRDVFAARPRVSRSAVALIDQRISYFEEKLRLPLFEEATAWPLLAACAEELVDEGTAAPAEYAANERRAISVRPSVIDSVEILDPVLKERCLDLFEQFREEGKQERLDTVLSEATKVLENRLHEACSAPAEITGVKLASYAFAGDHPRLKLSEIPDEQAGAHFLFRGAFGFVRNPSHHRLGTKLAPDRVLQLVAFVDYLLSLIERSQSSGPTGGEHEAAS